MGVWSPPEVFDEYRIIRPLGRGGMGRVFLAHDAILDRPVAVKFLSDFSGDATLRSRFLVEARAAARVQHPNVVTVFRVGELDDLPYIVSEYIRGRSLDKLDKPLPWPRVLEIGIALARGLAAAHRSGILHRDIKTANAMISEDGTVKLLDFGLAKFVEGAGMASLASSDGAPAPPARLDQWLTPDTPQDSAASTPEIAEAPTVQDSPRLAARDPGAAATTAVFGPAREAAAVTPDPLATPTPELLLLVTYGNVP